MAGLHILMSGSTGHVGYRTLIEALSKGYTVRAAVRNEASANKVRSAKSTQPYLEQLSFVIVPDITVDGAFDEAIKGVDYVVHVASPLPTPSDDDEKTMVRPAIRGTLSILHSALREPAIKKVVITSSVAAIMPQKDDVAFSADTVVPDPEGPYPHTFAAYRASKVKAYNATRHFIETQKPGFSVVNIMPSFVIGNNELARTPDEVVKGSNATALDPVLGKRNEDGMMASTVHVDDVAFVHIAALDPKIQGNHNFGANFNGPAGGVDLDSSIEIVRRFFPQEVEEGIFPLTGHTKSIPRWFDASHTEQTFNFRFKDWEQQVISIAAAYAKAVRNSAGQSG